MATSDIWIVADPNLGALPYLGWIERVSQSTSVMDHPGTEILHIILHSIGAAILQSFSASSAGKNDLLLADMLSFDV